MFCPPVQPHSIVFHLLCRDAAVPRSKLHDLVVPCRNWGILHMDLDVYGYKLLDMRARCVGLSGKVHKNLPTKYTFTFDSGSTVSVRSHQVRSLQCLTCCWNSAGGPVTGWNWRPDYREAPMSAYTKLIQPHRVPVPHMPSSETHSE